MYFVLCCCWKWTTTTTTTTTRQILTTLIANQLLTYYALLPLSIATKNPQSSGSLLFRPCFIFFTWQLYYLRLALNTCQYSCPLSDPTRCSLESVSRPVLQLHALLKLLLICFINCWLFCRCVDLSRPVFVVTKCLFNSYCLLNFNYSTTLSFSMYAPFPDVSPT